MCTVSVSTISSYLRGPMSTEFQGATMWGSSGRLRVSMRSASCTYNWENQVLTGSRDHASLLIQTLLPVWKEANEVLRSTVLSPFHVLLPCICQPFMLKMEREMATHSIILAWRIPWTEEPGGWSPWGHKESDMTEWLTLLLKMMT